MRWGINLRGDLAKLSDAELAEKFEFLISDRQAAYDAIHWIVGDEKRLYQLGLMFWWGRGLLHSPISTRLRAALSGVSVGVLANSTYLTAKSRMFVTKWKPA